MTILLPNDLPLFRKIFDNACDRILESSQDEMFYALFIQLIVQTREHPLLKDFIGQLEADCLTKQAEFSKTSLNYHEYNWKKLWQYHQHSYRHRKELVRIKRIVTDPRETSSDPLHLQLCAAMLDFRTMGLVFSIAAPIDTFFRGKPQTRIDPSGKTKQEPPTHYSSFFRFIQEAPLIFRRSQSDIQLGINVAKYFSPSKEEIKIRRKIAHHKIGKTHKLTKIAKRVSQQKLKSYRELNGICESISSLFSPLRTDLERKFGIPGLNSDQKRRNMRSMAALDCRSCWERFMHLEQCYNIPPDPLPLKRFFGKWKAIREQAWNLAWEKGHQEACRFAHMAFNQKLFSKSGDFEKFIPSEKQIHRRDYEEHLKSFQKHVHAHLCMIQSTQDHSESNLNLMSEGTQKANFVMQLARAYWKIHPQAKHDEVFGDYLFKCPQGKILSRTSWERIIRQRKLDPRQPDAKIRGKGKKTSQI